MLGMHDGRRSTDILQHGEEKWCGREVVHKIHKEEIVGMENCSESIHSTLRSFWHDMITPWCITFKRYGVSRANDIAQSSPVHTLSPSLLLYVQSWSCLSIPVRNGHAPNNVKSARTERFHGFIAHIRDQSINSRAALKAFVRGVSSQEQAAYLAIGCTITFLTGPCN